MSRVWFAFCLVLLSLLALGGQAVAADGGMGNMPMPSSTPAATAAPTAAPMQMLSSVADTSGPWRIATFALAALLIVGIALVRRDKRPATLALLVLAGVVIAGLAAYQFRAPSQGGDMSAMADMPGSAPVPVKTARVGDANLDPSIFVPVSLQPYLTQDVVARVSGVLTDFSAYAGDRLSAGQIIARLDEPDLQQQAGAAAADAQAQAAQVTAAQHDLSAAQSDVTAKREQQRYWQNEIRRERTLLAQGAVPQQEFEDERAQAAGADAAYQAALERVQSLHAQVSGAQAAAQRAADTAGAQQTIAGYTSVVAPDDGIVQKRLVDPGVYVQAGTPILRMAVTSKLRAIANVSQEDLAFVRVGSPMQISSSGVSAHATVTSIAPVADATTRTAAVEAVIPHPVPGMAPGAFATARLQISASRIPGSLDVPSAALVGGNLDTAVWVVARGTAHRVAVKVLRDDGTQATILAKLPSGARIIVQGTQDLHEGQAVTESAS